MEENKRKNLGKLIIIAIILVLIVVDQASKLYIVKSEIVSADKLSIHIIENILDITYVENRGGAFGIGQNSTIMFIIVNIIVLGIALRFMIAQKNMMNKRTQIALIFIISGGLSNLIDRLYRGFVLDFIDFSPLIRFPVFNIADILIVLGWMLLAIFTLTYYFNDKKGAK